MTDIILVTERFHPPWSDGVSVYNRGLVESHNYLFSRVSGVRLNIISLRSNTHLYRSTSDINDNYIHLYKQKFVNIKHYYARSIVDMYRVIKRELFNLNNSKSKIVLHVTYTKILPLILYSYMKILDKNILTDQIVFILRHFIMYRSSLLTHVSANLSSLFESLFLNQRLAHIITDKSLLYIHNIRTQFFIIPPAINLNRIKSIQVDGSVEDIQLKLLHGSLEDHFTSDYKILYLGPPTPDRFPLVALLGAITYLNRKSSLKFSLLAYFRYFPKYSRAVNNIVRLLKYKNIKYIHIGQGFLSENEKIRIMKMHDLLLYFVTSKPLITYVYPPLTILEAFASKVPVVAGNSQLLHNILGSDRGVFIKEITSKSIANAIDCALNDKIKIIYKSYNHIKKTHSLEAVSNKYYKLYRNIGII